MPETSPHLDLPYLLPAQAQKHVTHNAALQRLDLLAQLCVQQFGATLPPATPASGETHALGAAPEGAWTGQAGRLAAWDGTAWGFIPPREGWRAWGLAEGELRIWRAGAWQPLPLDNLDGLGVGTTHDATNRLAVAAAATLFSHAGAGHQVKINKAAAAQTASLLFQSNWAGRAELGLAGSDDFALKVSADGTTWTEALRAVAASGAVSLAPGLQIGGQMAYHRGNLLGTVTQAAGVPTGAAFETGSNANGRYIRHADGTQLCWKRLTLTAQDITTAYGALYRSGSLLSGNTAYAAAFAAAPAVQIMAHVADTSCYTVAGGAGDAVNAPASIYAVTNAALTGRTIHVNLCAIGRWF